MERISNIIFDFDGTLVDTTPLIMATMKAAIAELRLPPRTDAECKATIGFRLEDIPNVLWPGDSDASEYAVTYRRIFDVIKGKHKAVCYPGVIETLDLLHACGYRMAIASSRSRHSVKEYVKQLGISDYFSMIVGGNDVICGKPSAEPVRKILEECEWNAAETIVVGDAPVDIIMGKTAGTATCAMTYGNSTVDELCAVSPKYTLKSFYELLPILKGVTSELEDYVETQIIPQYDNFDKAHRRSHVRMVISQSLCLADKLPELDIDMVYCIAAFHDLGLFNGREKHHIESGRILCADEFINRYFTKADIEIMKEAIEDHRASGKTEPRSLYGKLVADADRFIDSETIIRRTIQYGISNYPMLDKDGHYQRMWRHITDKYGPSGYLRIWLPWSDNVDRLKLLHALIANENSLKELFNRIYDEELKE